MMRRCLLELSKGRRLLQPVPTQRPNLRTTFSSSSRHNASQKPSGSVGKTPVEPNSVGKTPVSGKGNVSKLVVGGVLIAGVVAAAAYQNLNQPNTKEEFDFSSKLDKVNVNDEEPSPSVSKNDNNVVQVEKIEKNEEAHLDNAPILDKSKTENEGELKASPKEETTTHVQQNDLPNFSQDGLSADEKISHSETLPKDIVDKKEVESGLADTQSSLRQNEVVTTTPIFQDNKVISEEAEIKEASAPHVMSQDASEVTVVDGSEPPSSLVDVYHLGEKNEKSTSILLDGKGPVGGVYISKDQNVVLEFLEAIHAAEKRQAELDAKILAEEKRILKEKYEKELRDARARELLYAEEAAILNKELNEEITTAAATVKTLEEKAEENLKMELEKKDNEVEMQLKKVKELAQAELAAAIAREKASQIEKMAEANLNIDALCMAFYARSEEARQSHSVHKLALGALALEDALSKGLPIQTEIRALHTYLEGIDKDSLLDLVLSSLPKETLNHGTETLLQLNQQFETLKTKLRHYSLIPPSGGGILTHAVAHFTSKIKVRENDISGDGIESIISRVERLLADGKLVEAADALEEGVRGSQAEVFVSEWVKHARNRAIAEQALSLLQSYATAVSVT